MDFWFLGLLAILGLVIGSFLTSFTYEAAKTKFSLSSLWRRSKCPKCQHVLSGRDNIPLLAFLMLGGKCRYCGKPISYRYPLIETITMIVFLTLGFSGVQSHYPIFYLLFIGAALLSVAIVDLEHRIIPDKIVIPLIIIQLSLIAVFSLSPFLFTNFFWASAASVFFLALYFVTRGRGMGLGDVKLAFLIGLILGEKSWVAIFLSFIIGAVVGILLIALGRARFGKPIPFGPFLVLGTLLALLWGSQLENLILGGVK